MRKILFRAKRLDNGEWIEGCYLKSPCEYTGFLKDFISVATYDEENECGSELIYKVDPKTVCQYTGRTNDNGVKIFEGDIVKDGIIFGDVVWDDPYIGFVINDIHDGHQEYSSWWDGLEVVGNIFDNMELLKGGGGDEE